MSRLTRYSEFEGRVRDEANYFVKNKSTIRQTAKALDVLKSCVHKDLRNHVAECCPELYDDVNSLLELNKSQRHIRGGEATKKRFLKQKNY